MHEIIAEDGGERKHLKLLRHCLESTSGPVRIATAYVTDTALLSLTKGRNVELLTSMSDMDVVSRATSLESLKVLIESGIKCRWLRVPPRLHAKVYIFSDKLAIVTSANLTASALHRNLEVGVRVTGSAVRELLTWFNILWAKARSLDSSTVSDWIQRTAPLRRVYDLVRDKADTGRILPNDGSNIRPKAIATLLGLLNKTSADRRSGNHVQTFLCNTDRRYSPRTPSGDYEREEAMRNDGNEGYAAAWETFLYPDHMKQVQRGDLIFMYANRIGIIGIGRAEEKCEEPLPFGSPGRLFDAPETPEWRIKVEWLFWNGGAPCPWKPHLIQSFINVSGEKYRERRAVVIKHLKSLSE